MIYVILKCYFIWCIIFIKCGLLVQKFLFWEYTSAFFLSGTWQWLQIYFPFIYFCQFRHFEGNRISPLNYIEIEYMKLSPNYPPFVCVLIHVRLCNPARLLCPGDFPGKNTGAGCRFLLEWIFPSLRDQTCISCIGRWFFNTEPPGKPIPLLLCVFAI